MNREAPKAGDLVFIVSAIDHKIKPKLGIGLIIEQTSSIPNGLDYSDIKETCTLFWGGEIEENIDIEWVEQVTEIDDSWNADS